MKELFRKECLLTAPAVTYFFLVFTLMAIIPGYPIAIGAFFLCLGLFYSYQSAREANDLLYTAMLPIKKSDVVRAKFAFAVFYELISLAVITVLTAVRMTALSHAAVYETNPMMNANLAYIGWVMMIFAAFSMVFIAGFFKTAYRIGAPFIKFCITSTLIIVASEALHHIPGLEGLNSTCFDTIQLIPLLAGALIFIGGQLLAVRLSIKRFDSIDL
ncbi:MAG: ABC-2 transporter permease [Clostridia bacterium]|nr:ABC-2 transporter permease [Clostridia bacterium]